jgi:hydrogenase maturation protease
VNISSQAILRADGLPSPEYGSSMSRNGEPPRQVVVGIGNPDRGDDGAGRIVARLLREASLPGIAVIKHDGEATGVLSKLEGAVSAYLMPVARTRRPGRCAGSTSARRRLPIRRSGARAMAWVLPRRSSSAARSRRCPRGAILYVIEGESFELGAPLSPPVTVPVADLVRHLAEQVGRKFC